MKYTLYSFDSSTYRYIHMHHTRKITLGNSAIMRHHRICIAWKISIYRLMSLPIYLRMETILKSFARQSRTDQRGRFSEFNLLHDGISEIFEYDHEEVLFNKVVFRRPFFAVVW